MLDFFGGSLYNNSMRRKWVIVVDKRLVFLWVLCGVWIAIGGWFCHCDFDWNFKSFINGRDSHEVCQIRTDFRGRLSGVRTIDPDDVPESRTGLFLVPLFPFAADTAGDRGRCFSGGVRHISMNGSWTMCQYGTTHGFGLFVWSSQPIPCRWVKGSFD